MKKKCIMAIKPEFYNKIKGKEKTVEYRKVAPQGVDKILLYVSSPISKILGQIEIETIIKNNIEEIWDSTKDLGGINKDIFLNYCKNKATIYAIYIKSFTEFETPIFLKKSQVPQNYYFLTDEEFSYLA